MSGRDRYFFNALATVGVFTANNNDAQLVESYILQI